MVLMRYSCDLSLSNVRKKLYHLDSSKKRTTMKSTILQQNNTKMRNISKLLLAVLCIASLSGYAQKTTAKADKEYNNFAYVDTIKTYERMFEKGYKSPDLLQKLGNAYYFQSELEKAAKWYGELFAMTQDVEPEYYYRYAQSLKAVKDYTKADQMMAIFNQKSGNDQRAKLAEAQKD